MKFLTFLVFLAFPMVAMADMVCFDTYTLPVEISTADYVAPDSTTTSQADLLKALYQAMYDRDFNYQSWHTLAIQWDDTLGDLLEIQAREWAAEDQYAGLANSIANSVVIPAPSRAGTGLAATYFDNMDFTGSTFTRVDPWINFDWGLGSPDSTISSDTFSARWVGKIVPRYNGPTTFYVQSNDAARLWIGGQLVVNDWAAHAVRESSGTMTLYAGQTYAFKMEYFEGGNTATVKLFWENASQPKQVIPPESLFQP